MNAQLPIPPDVSGSAAPAGLRQLASDHLRLRLLPLNRALRQLAQERSDRTAGLRSSDSEPPSISARHALQLFDEIDAVADGQPLSAASLAPVKAELTRETELRGAAESASVVLPLVAMQRALGLSAFETNAVVICAAPQLSLAYQRVFAFVHDDLNRLAPSLELMLRLEGRDPPRQLRLREALAPHGVLLRCGLLQSLNTPGSELQREFGLGQHTLHQLLRLDTDWRGDYRDPAEVSITQAMPLALFPDRAVLDDLARLLRGATPTCLGLWGNGQRGGLAAAIALAAAAGRPLRRLPALSESAEQIRQQLDIARALGAVLLIDTDTIDPAGTVPPATLAQFAIAGPADLILTGAKPWHPLELLHGRALVDLHLAAPDLAQRKAWWSASEPEIAAPACDALAARYRFSPEQIAAATASTRLLHPAALPAARAQALATACRAVSMQRAAQFAQVIVPKRQPGQLILPAALHRRVLEVAEFFKQMPRVDEGWGFGRLLSGAGTKVLMTGDSGTGKTAAAEVIAGQVAADQLLLKVNLAGVVSKWVGETERNLDAVFTHAEESHAALFFDEADALFAKRGEVERGADRYANLEVGFLLQRLEEFGGLAILASNHKDQLDEAFMRRFHVILHFPRPGIDERRKLWGMAIPPEAPLDKSVDLRAFDQLDLTGAGIVNAARLAAMLASAEGAETIGMDHLVAAVARQFQSEARLLTPSQLGEWAHLVAAPS